MTINTQRKQQLKAKAHKLKPVVIIGDKGLTENVLAEIDLALTAHELIKIKIASNDRTMRKALTEEICTKANAHLIQLIGNISIVYRQGEEK